jgi:acyl carrier protein
MKNKVKKLIVEVLKIGEDKYNEEMEIGDIPEWDSANNVKIIQALEDEFQINIDITDAIEMEGVSDIFIILKKYGIE